MKNQNIVEVARCLFYLAIVFVFIAVVVGISRFQYAKIIMPPEYIVRSEINTSEFHVYRENTTHFAIMPVNYDKTIWFRFSLPSGHPIYVYDNEGKLADWTLDEGDDSAFLQKWENLLEIPE